MRAVQLWFINDILKARKCENRQSLSSLVSTDVTHIRPGPDEFNIRKWLNAVTSIKVQPTRLSSGCCEIQGRVFLELCHSFEYEEDSLHVLSSSRQYAVTEREYKTEQHFLPSVLFFYSVWPVRPVQSCSFDSIKNKQTSGTTRSDPNKSKGPGAQQRFKSLKYIFLLVAVFANSKTYCMPD